MRSMWPVPVPRPPETRRRWLAFQMHGPADETMSINSLPVTTGEVLRVLWAGWQRLHAARLGAGQRREREGTW